MTFGAAANAIDPVSVGLKAFPHRLSALERTARHPISHSQGSVRLQPLFLMDTEIRSPYLTQPGMIVNESNHYSTRPHPGGGSSPVGLRPYLGGAMTLAAILGAVLLLVALRADNVLAHREEDTDVCVEDSAHRSIGEYQMYVSSTHNHVVVRPVSDVSVISVIEIETPFDYLGHHIDVGSDHVFMITYTVTRMPGVLEVCFEDDLGFWYPIAVSDGSSNNNGGTDNNNGGTDNNNGGTDNNNGGTDNTDKHGGDRHQPRHQHDHRGDHDTSTTTEEIGTNPDTSTTTEEIGTNPDTSTTTEEIGTNPNPDNNPEDLTNPRPDIPVQTSNPDPSPKEAATPTRTPTATVKPKETQESTTKSSTSRKKRRAPFDFDTPTPAPTATAIPVVARMAGSAATATPSPTPTRPRGQTSPTPTATPVPTTVPVATRAPEPTVYPSPTPTRTPGPTATPTRIPIPLYATPTPTPRPAGSETVTFARIDQPTVTPTPQASDVPGGPESPAVEDTQERDEGGIVEEVRERGTLITALVSATVMSGGIAAFSVWRRRLFSR